MDKKSLKGAIVGYGKMGIAHSTILNALENNSIIAICEPNSFINSLLKKIFKNRINIYEDFNSLLTNENVDYVFITSPNSLHKEHILKCLNNNINFFVEKPVALNEYEANEIIKQYYDNFKTVNMVGYMLRHINSFKKVKNFLQKKIIGDVINFQGSMYVSQVFNKGTGWRYNKDKSGGGVVMAHASHIIDLICWYLGYPNKIEAKCEKIYSEEIEDYGHIYFKYNDNIFGWIDCSWSMNNYRSLSTNIKIYGTNGEIHVGDDYLEVFIKEKNDYIDSGWHSFDKIDLYTNQDFDIGQEGYCNQNKIFLQNISNNKTENLSENIINGCIIQKIISKIYLSSENNKILDFNG